MSYLRGMFSLTLCLVLNRKYLFVFLKSFEFRASRNDGLSIQMFLHHFLSLYGIGVALYLGGMIGSISQLTWITEGSTLFVNLRYLMVYHKYDKTNSKMYIFNGFLMTLTFGIFRIYFYHVMIFDILLTYVVYRTHSFWPIFYKGKFV